jgi:uracil-DNA glycosylase
MTVTRWDPLRGTDWESLLKPEFGEPYWADLAEFVEEERARYEVYPPPDEVFAALRLTPCAETKVVIVGQDPYFHPGEAHGLRFSVRHGVRVPGSLKNIHRELHDDLGVPIPEHGNLESWARRGVLLLNTTLTVRKGAKGSHRGKGWERFTGAVIRMVSETADPVFILWGKDAQQMVRSLASPRKVIASPHPSPLSANRGFFGSKPFSRTNHSLVVAGREEIDWSLTE